MNDDKTGIHGAFDSDRAKLNRYNAGSSRMDTSGGKPAALEDLQWSYSAIKQKLTKGLKI